MTNLCARLHFMSRSRLSNSWGESSWHLTLKNTPCTVRCRYARAPSSYARVTARLVHSVKLWGGGKKKKKRHLNTSPLRQDLATRQTSWQRSQAVIFGLIRPGLYVNEQGERHFTLKGHWDIKNLKSICQIWFERKTLKEFRIFAPK